ncbi:hypothetical protein BMH32_03160 [Leucobacter sp. OLJS4]|uniref:DUF937 domain-containing protein n=1 Tax=unclassified Leucobacter TaxID=2621730 RepID=UPI000C184623|nr:MULTISPECIES: DUF937 domain-containing protein [unclassified Leucobacter]PIJ54152.1 hypothetical protein BMH30_02240 [Leucobacter sp. OLES1]PII84078.1 hypothetical protein BMH25_04890 [Leucobacter sp. OLCALW19]PII88327.1 hypothetical protein BMH26_06275 [Leucobacter sp. OLTLW20]PII92306.1 hypothetical protein BMH27_05700 [Leucobacter sp. OLAS13]PII99711.1 hypothetical protein BMH29_04070 [Leucobacter sp. OLDS2]
MAQNSVNLDDLMQQIPLGDLAQRFGVDESTMGAAVQQALPGLLGGMAVNAQDAEGAGKLEAALGKHAPASGTIDLNAIDEEDGGKIVNHVLGDKQGEVAQALGANSGDSTVAKLIPVLLPLLAPIVMQFLSGAFSKQQSGSDSASTSGGGIGDLLGGLLGGGSGSQQSGGGLGDLLGGLLGGGSGSGQSAGGGLGDLLGGLFGGKK